MARKPKLTLVEIQAREPINDHMVRLVLQGDAFAGYPSDGIGGYIKFAFDRDGMPLTNTDDVEDIMLRTYTIRALDTHSRRLTVDMVLHGNDTTQEGPASAFARRAKAGDHIAITGPGSVKSLDPAAAWYLIVGDMTALPAIAAKLERLRQQKAPIIGHLLLEVSEPRNTDYIQLPEGLELHTLVNPDPAMDTESLLAAVRRVPWLDGPVFAWCAAEFGRMRPIRDYLRRERAISLEDRYVSSYWMLGHTEEGHKAEKKRDPERD